MKRNMVTLIFRIFHPIWLATLHAGRRSLCWIVSNPAAVGIASLAWLIARSAMQPRRLAYPCQRAAAANVSALAVAAAAGMAMPHRARRWLLSNRIARAAAAVLVIAGVAWAVLPPLFQPALPLALIEQQHLADRSSYDAAEMSARIEYPSATEAAVSVAYDPKADYPPASPFDPPDNPVYPLVRRAVAGLGLGTPDNPLKGFIQQGQRVLIKPNIEGAGQFQFTHPSVVRAVIDLAAQAGAGEIIVAESSPCLCTKQALEGSGYIKMIDDLNARGTTPCRLILRNLEGTAWSWVDTGPASAYPPGKFKDTDLATSQGDNTYHQQTDSHGRNPRGRLLNQNALFDSLFNADVIINVPRLKVHGMIINTLAIKNFVGITVSSTTGTKPAENTYRIAHYGMQKGPKHIVQGFGNDILWRELANIWRPVIYWKDGTMHTTPQRKILCILDAIGAGNGSHGNGPKVQVGYVLASVDPIAIDAVGSRLMRYDFRQVPIINNAPSVPSHPWGTNDPARIRLIGDPIGPGAALLFANPYDKEKEFKNVIINDLDPPQLSALRISTKNGTLTITVDSRDACAAFLRYRQPGGEEKIIRMA
ncbi:MAG TPA: DUF362 domain-containing protein, partial [Planctomycetota bacterium]|nr:DUF362 domain-containing protein [Planctomycetota bacterium]